MALDPQAQAAIALHRFGFGPREGSIAAIGSDARGALLSDLDGRTRVVARAELPGSSASARAAYEFQQEKKVARFAAKADNDAGKSMMSASGDAAMDAKAGAKPAANPGPGVPQQLYLDSAKARFDAALNAEIGFVERLTWFWSNHFCVSAEKVRPTAGAFEREAIRPHVLGKFSDMLLAVETHPAMLMYLDNARSIGPNSFAGQRRGKGLNENLAREILELHTLGVRTGYSQDDVTNFAKVITGWTVIPFRQDMEHGGEFTFNPRMHEPDTQRVLGTDYADIGVEQGRAVLLALARRPETAKHIATKLARHFIADNPAADLVERLAKRFRETDGDLKQVAKALVTAPQALDAPRTKLKRPGEWIVASMRATGMQIEDVRRVIQTLNMLGEPLWQPPAPKGFPDENAAWNDGLAQRLDIANQVARRLGDKIDPEVVAETALGTLASAQTREALKRAESRPQALTLLLMSPEFQRR